MTASSKDVSLFGAKCACPLSPVVELMEMFSDAGQAPSGSIIVAKRPAPAAAKFPERSNVFHAVDILRVALVCISDKLSDDVDVASAPQTGTPQNFATASATASVAIRSWSCLVASKSRW
jgi:hypothetical protein